MSGSGLADRSPSAPPEAIAPTYTYLVNLLQRISVYPANHAIELAPRMWKSLFADGP